MIPVIKNKTTLILALLLALYSCSHYNTSSDYLHYIGESKNGLKITKQYTGVELTAQYLPPELKALQEMEAGGGNIRFDSLRAACAQSCNFLFTIAPSRQNPVNDMNYYGIGDYDQFTERKKALNWYLEECFILKTDDKEFYPALFHFEQDYGISGTLKFHIAFVPDGGFEACAQKSETFALLFNDPFYGTEQTEFVFTAASLKNIPEAK